MTAARSTPASSCPIREILQQSALFGEAAGISDLARELPRVRVVECWIGVVQDAQRTVVRLAGRLSAAQVPELLVACQDATSLQLDLTELVSADVAGVDALRRLRSSGATFVGAVGYIQMKLDSQPHRA